FTFKGSMANASVYPQVLLYGLPIASKQTSTGELLRRVTDLKYFIFAIKSARSRPFGDSPVQVTCPKCHQTVVTEVQFSAGLLTYLFCGGLLFCGCVLGCCLIPFCVNRLRDVTHICPSCKAVLGAYKRL
uniref:Lipopolysaccharide induced TNF factor n=1 Tax=Scleropages formosus TaxID=113540 RepID=A0A8C9R9R3_SCLFO